jgi:hypothetical protein
LRIDESLYWLVKIEVSRFNRRNYPPPQRIDIIGNSV